MWAGHGKQSQQLPSPMGPGSCPEVSYSPVAPAPCSSGTHRTSPAHAPPVARAHHGVSTCQTRWIASSWLSTWHSRTNENPGSLGRGSTIMLASPLSPRRGSETGSSAAAELPGAPRRLNSGPIGIRLPTRPSVRSPRGRCGCGPVRTLERLARQKQPCHNRRDGCSGTAGWAQRLDGLEKWPSSTRSCSARSMAD